MRARLSWVSLLVVCWTATSYAADITKQDFRRMATEVGSALSTRAQSAWANAPVVVGSGRSAHLFLGGVGFSATYGKAIAATDDRTLQRQRQLRLGLTVGPHVGVVLGRAKSWFKPDTPTGAKIEGIAISLGPAGGVNEHRVDNPNSNTYTGLQMLSPQDMVVGQPAGLGPVGGRSSGRAFGLALGRFKGVAKVLSKNIGKPAQAGLTEQQRTTAAATPVAKLVDGKRAASSWTLLLEVEARGDYLRQELRAVRRQADQPQADFAALHERLAKLLPEAQAVARVSNGIVEGFLGLR